MYWGSPTSTFLQLLATAALAHAQGNSPYGTQCVSGVHMIVARGSIEPSGPGIIGDVAYEVLGRIPNSNMVSVPYPATLSKYKFSEEYGVGNMTKLLKEYHDACPDSKVALLGYSQGAQIIGNMLCGNSERKWNQTDPLPLKYSKNVIAVIQWGDPTFRPGLVWDVGTSTSHGLFPRRNLKHCRPYADVVQSYCDKNDIACASGNSVEVHTSYNNVYTQQSANFIVEKYNNPMPLNPRPIQIDRKCRRSRNSDCSSGRSSHRHSGSDAHSHHSSRHSSGSSSGPGAFSRSNHGKNSGPDCDKCSDDARGSSQGENKAGRSLGNISIMTVVIAALSAALTV